MKKLKQTKGNTIQHIFLKKIKNRFKKEKNKIFQTKEEKNL